MLLGPHAREGRDSRLTSRCAMQRDGAEQQQAHGPFIALNVGSRAQGLAGAPAGAVACLMVESNIGSTASLMASRRCSAVSLELFAPQASMKLRVGKALTRCHCLCL